jgi:deoxyribodipyrimidine photo-lyase
MHASSIFWFRRDLRLFDNRGLYEALKGSKSVLAVFIFDSNILSTLEDKSDKRVSFIFEKLKSIEGELKKYGSAIKILYGKPAEVWSGLISSYQFNAVYFNKDYEPYAIQRDRAVTSILNKTGITSNAYKDQVVFEENDILKADSNAYTVFTPYSRKWKTELEVKQSALLKHYPSEKYLSKLQSHKPSDFDLHNIGFKYAKTNIKEPELKHSLIRQYHLKRDYPAINGTSRLSVHLRFGTISIRETVRTAKELNEVWLNELIWREFYMMILYQFPYVVNKGFKKVYDQIERIEDEDLYEKWCKGKTGIPLVDAGMRELNTTGFMHNRIRMITAVFLTKNLLMDWRLGEAYFAQKLMDYELASNNGGWQWAAGTGCDAAPYFRIFNPYTQAERFDPDQKYIKKWVAEFGTSDYPKPIVDYKSSRERAISAYKKVMAIKFKEG